MEYQLFPPGDSCLVWSNSVLYLYFQDFESENALKIHGIRRKSEIYIVKQKSRNLFELRDLRFGALVAKRNLVSVSRNKARQCYN